MRFRWVRKRVKIVSRDESWPEKERQAKGKKCIVKFHFFPTSYLVSLFFFPKLVISPTTFMAFLMSRRENQNPRGCGMREFHRWAHKTCDEDGSQKRTLYPQSQPDQLLRRSPQPSAAVWPQNKTGGQTPEAEEEEQLSVLPAVPNKQWLSQFWKSPGWRHPCFPQTASSSLSDIYDHFLWAYVNVIIAQIEICNTLIKIC